MKHLIAIDDLSREEIDHIIHAAKTLIAEPRPDLLNGQILATCFFEPSTRTRISFETAMLKGGGSVVGFSDAETTSSKKGESLSDTIRVMSSYADILVVRHPQDGSARIAADSSKKPVINAGDGSNQHPTQTLVDLFSILACQQTIDSLHIALAGDLKFGRTAHSLALALANYHVHLHFISPESLSLPESVQQELKKTKVPYSFHTSLNTALPKIDVLYMTRIQKERFPQGSDYENIDAFRLLKQDLDCVRPNFKILHPLPRVDEIDKTIDATDFAYYFEQAAYGVPVRMALMGFLLGKL